MWDPVSISFMMEEKCCLPVAGDPFQTYVPKAGEFPCSLWSYARMEMVNSGSGTCAL